MADQSLQVFKGAYEAFTRGDVPAALGALAEDVEWYEAEGMPYGGLHRGGEAVARAVFGPLIADIWDVRDDKTGRFRQFADTAKFLEVVPARVAPAA